MNCSTALMPTYSSTELRLQPVWHGAGHTRPIMEGNGLASGAGGEAVSLPLHILGRLLDAAHDVEPAADVFTGRAACLAGRGLVHVGRALVGGISREDTGLEGGPFLIAVLVLAERESSLGCLGLVCGSCHCESPDLNNSMMKYR